MDTQEARALAASHLETWRKRSYEDLVTLMDRDCCEHTEVFGPSGTWYQVEVNVFWDDRPGGDVRVMLSIDDGGWRAFVPLTDSFIMAPDGTFVGG